MIRMVPTLIVTFTLALAQSALGADLAPGQYQYKQKEDVAVCSVSKNEDDEYSVSLEYINPTNMHTCDFTAPCLVAGDTLVCITSDDIELAQDENSNPFTHNLTMRITPKGLMLLNFNSFVCNIGLPDGPYIKK